MGAPKEDPADKKAREAERRKAKVEQRKSAQDNAAGLTSDLRGVYGASTTPAMSMFSKMPGMK